MRQIFTFLQFGFVNALKSKVTLPTKLLCPSNYGGAVLSKVGLKLYISAVTLHSSRDWDWEYSCEQAECEAPLEATSCLVKVGRKLSSSSAKFFQLSKSILFENIAL
jgi:hypothetical protein